MYSNVMGRSRRRTGGQDAPGKSQVAIHFLRITGTDPTREGIASQEISFKKNNYKKVVRIPIPWQIFKDLHMNIYFDFRSVFYLSGIYGGTFRTFIIFILENIFRGHV